MVPKLMGTTKAAFQEHKDMSQFLETLDSQDAALRQVLPNIAGITIPTRTYEATLHEVKEHATHLDNWYAKNKQNCNANQADGQRDGGRSGGRGGGRGDGRGRGRGLGRGRGTGRGDEWLSPSAWAALLPEEKEQQRNA